MKVRLQPLGDWAHSFELIFASNALLVVMTEALPPIPCSAAAGKYCCIIPKLKNCKFGSVFYQS